jgi:hypothetical protein
MKLKHGFNNASLERTLNEYKRKRPACGRWLYLNWHFIQKNVKLVDDKVKSLDSGHKLIFLATRTQNMYLLNNS